jgi:hypothetical protein
MLAGLFKQERRRVQACLGAQRELAEHGLPPLPQSGREFLESLALPALNEQVRS